MNNNNKEKVIFAEATEKLLLRDKFFAGFNRLTERQRRVISLRFGLIDGFPRTLEETGNLFNVTRERVRTIEAGALQRLSAEELKALLLLLNYRHKSSQNMKTRKKRVTINLDLSNEIIKLRQAGKTQSEVATKLGVSQPTVSNVWKKFTSSTRHAEPKSESLFDCSKEPIVAANPVAQPGNSIPMKKPTDFYSGPPQQGRIGGKPLSYIDNELPDNHGPYTTSVEFIPEGGKRALDRSEVREVSHNPRIHPLVIYACIMAWGGRNFSNYRLSLDGLGARKVIDLVTHLRVSKETRQKDFAYTQRAANEISGLGISFYTKLLFFLRKEPDAYIFDQWTAKSGTVLFPRAKINLTRSGYPDPETSPETYEAFCLALESCTGPGGWGEAWKTGEEVERTIFDGQRGQWRSWLKNLFNKADNEAGLKAQSKGSGTQPPASPEGATAALPGGDTGNAPLIRISDVAKYWGLRKECGDKRNYYGNVSKGSKRAVIALTMPAVEHIRESGGNFENLTGYDKGPSKEASGSRGCYVGHVSFDSAAKAFQYLAKYFSLCACETAIESLKKHNVESIKKCTG